MADWTNVTVPAGSTESAEFPIPRELVIAPPGQVSEAGGKKAAIKKADYDVADVAAGVSSKIVLTEAATVALVFKVKAVDDGDDDDDDEDEAEPPTPEQRPPA